MRQCGDGGEADCVYFSSLVVRHAGAEFHNCDGIEKDCESGQQERERNRAYTATAALGWGEHDAFGPIFRGYHDYQPMPSTSRIANKRKR